MGSEVVTFYSYKGGSGRSVLVANVATLLAQEGYNIACVDLDLEAPGMDVVFDISNEVNGRPSVVDYFLGKLVELEDICIDYGELHNLKGNLYVFYAERLPEELSREDIQDDRKKKSIKKAISCMVGGDEGNGRSLVDLIYDIQKEYDLDYIFLDSSSGYTEQSSVAFCESDKLVIVSRYSYQHIAGTLHILKLARFLKEMAETLSRSFEYYIVLNNVPKSLPETRKKELDEFQKEYKAAIIYEIDELKWRDKILINNDEVRDQFTRIANLVLES